MPWIAPQLIVDIYISDNTVVFSKLIKMIFYSVSNNVSYVDSIAKCNQGYHHLTVTQQSY